MTCDRYAVRRLARRLGWRRRNGEPGPWIHQWEGEHGAAALFTETATDWTGVLRVMAALWLANGAWVVAAQWGVVAPPLAGITLGAMVGTLLSIVVSANSAYWRVRAYNLLSDPVWRVS